MSGSFLSRLGFTSLGLLLACSGGDLTLPGPDEPAAPEPALLKIVSGDGQRAERGAVLEHPLTVQVLDDSGEPMPEVTVQFGFVDELPEAGLLPPSNLTNPEGHATAFAKLGAVAGRQVIRASVAGSDSPNLTVEFRATAIGPDDDDGDQGGGDDDGGGGDDDDDDDEGSGGGDWDDDD